ncbi:pimeloyl-ACP methyl ester esterase BioH [Psychrosphaera haliotis]|uniref:Pimeloyl-ACP methyl ester esterase BioH n=1 Tax=Psychrosphaera haliotis TaxID=555083 RepID=A0A6N8FGS6_9GAMM|nr:pimeloyl-ACP methyl ester esterase BioH [Psychrosphaera haliotis]MUH73461.1 pimeloyl-ACP methyl ester esterase BioH [Psychrosphaera haliotis]
MNDAPIILIHGWGMNKQIWNGVLDSLSPELLDRVTVVDMPGYGNNTETLERYDIDELAGWLKSIVKQPSHIVGWSLGGLLAIKFAQQYPDLTVGVGLVASTPKFMEEGDWLGIKPNVLAMFSKQLLVDHKDTVKRFLKIQALGSESMRADLKQIQEWVFSVPDPKIEALDAGLTMLQNVDLREEFSSLTVPVNALLGRLDSLVPNSVEHKLIDLLPGAKITVMPGVSHAPFISKKEQFIKWLQIL